MGKVLRLTETELVNLINKIIKEEETTKTIGAKCWDINKLKSIAQPLGLKIILEPGRYAGDDPLIYAQSMTGNIELNVNEDEEPYFPHIITYELTENDGKTDYYNIKMWDRKMGGGYVIERQYGGHKMMYIKMSNVSEMDKIKCGDYESVKNIMGVFSNFVKFMGPNFRMKNPVR